MTTHQPQAAAQASCGNGGRDMPLYAVSGAAGRSVGACLDAGPVSALASSR